MRESHVKARHFIYEYIKHIANSVGHSVSQRPNLRHLGEPLGGAESLLEAVSFKVTEGMGRGRVANVRWERVPHSGGCNTETTAGKCSANNNNRKSARRAQSQPGARNATEMLIARPSDRIVHPVAGC